jgi:prolyl-tRNA editing enzyme YbaK/EbsC (Cys-tRNA(Pro) deacylase)
VADKASGSESAAGADNTLDHPSVVRVRAVLETAGAQSVIVILDDHARTAAAAAEQLGVTVAQIANSLIFALPAEEGAEPEPLLVLTSGAHRVDTVKVADLIGVERLDRADAAFVRERTGFAIGGVAPVGHSAAIRTLVDVSLAQHQEIWAAAGHPRSVFRTSYDELLRLTGGSAVEVV